MPIPLASPAASGVSTQGHLVISCKAVVSPSLQPDPGLPTSGPTAGPDPQNKGRKLLEDCNSWGKENRTLPDDSGGEGLTGE
jgi:hypothetical protein